MKVEELRDGVFSLTLTTHELSIIIAGARMSLDLMEQDPTNATAQAKRSLSLVLERLNHELAREVNRRQESNGKE
jgi:hypothetical protein